MPTEQSFFEKLLQLFDQSGTKKIMPKGAMVLREGEVEKHIYWIKSGAVRLFYLTEHEEQTVRLGYDHSLINSLSSFLREQPSEFYLEVLRKTTLKALTKDQLMQLVNESEENLRQYTRLLESVVSQQVDREVDLLITSPAERLKRVLDRSPHLFQHIPLKYIASYLRMKPETLSRIRNP